MDSSLSNSGGNIGSPQQLGTQEKNATSNHSDTDVRKGWEAPFASKFAAATDNNPTPGISDAIIDALHLDGIYGEAHMLMLIESMRKEDFPVAFEILRKAKTLINSRTVGDQGPSMWIAFWQRFGELDPNAALKAALDATSLNYARRETLEKHLFTGMGRADPVRAAEAFLAHPELLHPNRAVEGLMVSWAAKDAQAAVAWARQNLETDKLKTALYATAWGLSTVTDISTATKLLTDLPEDVPRESVINSLKSQIRQKEELPVPQILDFITATRAVGASDQSFELNMASRCAERDPFAAAEFFARPAGADVAKTNAEGLRIVVGQWAGMHPDAAESWAKGQEGTPNYPLVAGLLAQAARQRGDAEAAQRWNAAAAQK